MPLFRRTTAFTALLTLLCAGAAVAHPLGNFTINHLSRVSAAPHRIDVRYVLDIAEIPTFQIARGISADGNLTSAQLSAWGRTEAAALLPELDLTIDGSAASLQLDRESASERPGAGGLKTLYLTLDAHANASAAVKTIEYHDRTFSSRLGWKDVVAREGDDPTRELTQYPNAMLASPRNLSSVRIALGAGAPALTPLDGGNLAAAGASVPAMRSNTLSDFLARGVADPVVVLTTLLVAIALGALHALEPGHGKALLAVTLVGARATVKQAAILAAALTFAHTAAVLALGIAINLFKGFFVPEDVYPWITLVSGAVIAVIGARALQRQLGLRTAALDPARSDPSAHTHAYAHEHAHGHDHVHEHSHGHTHSHGHGHAHSHAHELLDDDAHARMHAIPGSAPLGFGSTVWAAMSGGIAPCPAALVVLLAAIALNEVAYGIVVIVAFSFGLAATLTGLGIAVVRGAGAISARPEFARFVKYGPLASASIMAIVGCIMLGNGFVERGFDASPIPVAALAATAVAAYAFGHGFAHRHHAEPAA